MGWRSLLITKHSKVSYKMNHIVITTMDDVVQVPLDDINIIIVGSTQVAITSYAIMAMLQKNVALIFTDEQAMPIGQVANYYGNSNRNVNIASQIEWSDERKQNVWTSIITAKMNNSVQVLAAFGLDTSDVVTTIAAMQYGDVTNREGVVAKLYFHRLFENDFARHNDDLEVNGVLDYGYAVLLAATAREIAGNGYLTQLGVHHRSQTNEYNLASDLMEPFRPFVDKLVVEEKIAELTTDNKGKMIGVLNTEFTFNGHRATVQTAIADVVRDTLEYLSGANDDFHLGEFKL